MSKWREDVIQALRNLEGKGHLSQIKSEMMKILETPYPENLDQQISGTLQKNSKDSKMGKRDVFYSIEGLGSGMWGLNEMRQGETVTAIDLYEPPERIKTTVSRIIRDTKLAVDLKMIYQNKCQICGTQIQLVDKLYSEAHHIRPLGGEHRGPDILGNLLVVCPNHHAQLDYGAIGIDVDNLMATDEHKAKMKEYVTYHNINIYKSILKAESQNTRK